MALNNLINEARLKVVLKADKKIPAKLLQKIERSGLKGEELLNLKKTVLMQLESGISERSLYKLVNDYLNLANYVHKKGQQLI